MSETPSTLFTPLLSTHPHVSMPNHLPPVSRLKPLKIFGYFDILAGVVGFWAVFFRSKRLSNVYMLTRPASFLLEVWTGQKLRSSSITYGTDLDSIGMMYSIGFFVALYDFKVGCRCIIGGSAYLFCMRAFMRQVVCLCFCCCSPSIVMFIHGEGSAYNNVKMWPRNGAYTSRYDIIHQRYV